MARLAEQLTKPLQVKTYKTLSGPFTILGVFNQNNRRYPIDVYETAYGEVEPKIKERRLLGELDHPLDYDEVRLSNVSHVITECHIGNSKSGNRVVYGTVELLDTPAGRVAQALVKAGIPLGISSRGIGNTKQVSEGVDVTQLKLLTYDLVAEPSFETAILSESKKDELSESLSLIECKLPLNESIDSNKIRGTINHIRESLCLTDKARVHINTQDVPTMELNALQSLLKEKVSIIESDTERLIESRQQQIKNANIIKALKLQLEEMKSRYTALRENHQELQDSYNQLNEEREIKEKNILESKSLEILELKKRLAVERRGMSYNQVSELLEGVNSEKDIDSRLDSISNFNRRSSPLDIEEIDSLKESIITPDKGSRLSKIIAKI